MNGKVSQNDCRLEGEREEKRGGWEGNLKFKSEAKSWLK
jgi:hypothetical protein